MKEYFLAFCGTLHWLTVESDTIVMLLTFIFNYLLLLLLLLVFSHPLTLSFQALLTIVRVYKLYLLTYLLKPSFPANRSHRSLLFSLGLTTWIPQTVY